MSFADVSPSLRSGRELSGHERPEELLELLLRLAAETRVHDGRLDDRARRRDEPVEARGRVERGDRAARRVAGGDPLDRGDVAADGVDVELRPERSQPGLVDARPGGEELQR